MKYNRVAPRIKEYGTDRMGQGCYQILEGKGREVLLLNIYQVYATAATAEGKLTNNQQQQIMLSKENRDTDPRKAF